ncbi:MAG: diadenylate cyclase CdaA [Acidobacteriota bacterium]
MSLAELAEALSWRDALDILVVAIIAYQLLLLIRGTRAAQVLLGIVVLVGVALIARALELRSLQSLLEQAVIFVPFAVIVLFQNQIRKALVNFGRNPLYGFSAREQVESGFQQLVLAATTMAKRRVGALIVFERHQGLRDFIENGIQLDSVISLDLLLTIFNPGTPLHDGAVIVQRDRIAAAACFLPLSSNTELSMQLGTRHRAALGISEETDAVALVVSEESGRISLAVNGSLDEGLDADELRSALYRHLVTETEESTEQTEVAEVGGRT